MAQVIRMKSNQLLKAEPSFSQFWTDSEFDLRVRKGNEDQAGDGKKGQRNMDFSIASLFLWPESVLSTCSFLGIVNPLNQKYIFSH
ncbi:MAG: hypothetical protein HY774_09180 [Acidobacteria bacterium]|nr:hypothetical protein [Acidobacteriota bacterium]